MKRKLLRHRCRHEDKMVLTETECEDVNLNEVAQDKVTANGEDDGTWMVDQEGTGKNAI
jgi:hypothetical protein